VYQEMLRKKRKKEANYIARNKEDFVALLHHKDIEEQDQLMEKLLK
jgi:hypothetical protein